MKCARVSYKHLHNGNRKQIACACRRLTACLPDCLRVRTFISKATRKNQKKKTTKRICIFKNIFIHFKLIEMTTQSRDFLCNSLKKKEEN